MLIKKEFFRGKARIVARKLVGKIIEYDGIKAIISETEAYEDDEASHAFRRTKRSEIMYDSYGKIYVYFVYGNYYCLNITCDSKGPGAVLIRCLNPINKISLLKKRRNMDNINNLLNGPGKLCQALNINISLNGTDLNNKIKLHENNLKFKIVKSRRIGISKAKDLEWRFFIKNV